MFGKAYQIFQRNIHGEKDSRQAKGRDDIMPGKLVYELLKKERNKQKQDLGLKCSAWKDFRLILF